MKKSVVLVEDDQYLQQELVSLINLAPDIECLYAVSSGEEALLKIPKNIPDLVLMDIQLPGLNGIDCIEILRRNHPDLEIIVLTIYEDPENIFRALKAGASGYLIKTTDPAALHAAVRDVVSGGAPLTAHIARKIVHRFRRSPVRDYNNRPLSPREEEVLELLATGCRYREVGERLHITSETVKSHIKNIRGKLQVGSKVAAIVKYCDGDPGFRPSR